MYQYDARGRVIRKHIPSAGWTELVYDQQDRLVMSQDQQDKAANAWRFTRYDGLSRVVQTGRLPLNRAADDLRTDFAGVSNETFPATVNPAATDLLTESIYDNYTGSPLSFDPGNAFTTPWSNATGLLTRTGVRNLETGAWYSSAMWYDDKARTVQQQSQNHLNGTDITNTQYRFNGEVVQSILRHQPGGGVPITPVTTAYTYDHLGRRTGLTHAVGSGTTTSIATYRYDALGRLSRKQLQAGGSGGGQAIITRNATPGMPTQDVASQYVEITPESFDVNLQNNPSGLYEARIGGGGGGSTLQTLDYRYHLRGWLRGVNVDAGGQPQLSADRGDVFAFGLDYETAGQFDGNIGRQRWVGSRQAGQVRQYSYEYDAARRIMGATFAGAGGENYTVSGMSYDANGNILTLNRATFDQLTYSYGPGNSLMAVGDGSGNTQGFADGNTGGDDYAYWPDGSLKKDLNRGITDIQYNLLKLPRQVSFTNGKVVQYQYDAGGSKLRMSASTGEVRDYVGPFQYLNDNLFELAHEEGRYTAGGGYEYYHRDHLGNIRAVQGQSGVTQWQDYDPWGLELSTLSSGSSSNRYTFNGKEAVTELGGGLLDFGHRGYDATIGRMHQVDAAAVLFADVSGYNYGLNNPIFNIDPTGDTTIPANQLPTNWHTFDTKKDDVLLNAVTVIAQGDGKRSSDGWLGNENGQLLNRDGTAYWDSKDMFNTQLMLVRKEAGSEWVDRADNLLAIFSPIKALQGLFLFSKINPTGKVIAAEQLAATGGNWLYGAFKSEAKWANQLSKRGWTAEQITEAVTKGKSFDAVNMVNKTNSATRYVHPTTGQSVVIDNVTKELLHVGGSGFQY